MAAAAATTTAAPPTWAELLGSKSWEGLLDPLHQDLRQFILHCGDFIQVTYDAFNSDPRSAYSGSSRYGKKDFFHKVQFDEAAAGYDVVGFLYATASSDLPAFLVKSLSRESWDKESNWMGYIAVSNDQKSKELGRREIYVVWRGTIRDMEWLAVLKAQSQSIELLLSDKDKDTDKRPWFQLPNVLTCNPEIEKGWFTIYTGSSPKSLFCKMSARDQLHAKIKELVSLYKDEDISIVCAGHSLGASLATVSAFDIAENGLSKVGDRPAFPVTAVVFGSPQVGNKAFNDLLNKLDNLRVLHIRNEPDLIPHMPGNLLGYQDTGVEILIDSRKSTYLKNSVNPGDWHNLQAILHVVAGWMGKNKAFELQVERCLALVNKSCDFLKEELLVPPSWWTEKNKGMEKGQDGVWYLAPPPEEDLPVPEFENQ